MMEGAYACPSCPGDPLLTADQLSTTLIGGVLTFATLNACGGLFAPDERLLSIGAAMIKRGIDAIFVTETYPVATLDTRSPRSVRVEQYATRKLFTQHGVQYIGSSTPSHHGRGEARR